MKLSIFTTVTSPTKRGDAYQPALNCYCELGDEVIIVHGDGVNVKPLDYNHNNKEIKHIVTEWPKEFRWTFIGQQFQKGYETCSGDWVIHADLDFIFHEQDFDSIRKACEDNKNAPALSFWKHQFIVPDRYNLKSRLVIAVNKGKFGDRIKFDGGGDLCQPTLDGKYISPNDVPEARVPFYNYEKMTKTKTQIRNDAGRMERAYARHFGHTQYGSDGTDEDAYNKWYEAQKGKFNKPQEHIPLKAHPKYIQETIKNLKPDQFGYNGFGLIDGRVYA